ncbi:MAG: hypothetical protein PGN25_01400 [Methylorubrum populi]
MTPLILLSKADREADHVSPGTPTDSERSGIGAIDEIAHEVGEVAPAAPLGDLDHPLPGQRIEGDEQVGGAAADISLS